MALVSRSLQARDSLRDRFGPNGFSDPQPVRAFYSDEHRARHRRTETMTGDHSDYAGVCSVPSAGIMGPRNEVELLSSLRYSASRAGIHRTRVEPDAENITTFPMARRRRWISWQAGRCSSTCRFRTVIPVDAGRRCEQWHRSAPSRNPTRHPFVVVREESGVCVASL